MAKDILSALASANKNKKIISSADVISKYLVGWGGEEDRRRTLPGFLGYEYGEQYGAHEFLTLFLEQFYPLKKSWFDKKTQKLVEKLVDNHMFLTKIKSEKYCGCAGGADGKGPEIPRETSEFSSHLNLPVKTEHQSIQEILQDFQGLNPITDYMCESCK